QYWAQLDRGAGGGVVLPSERRREQEDHRSPIHLRGDRRQPPHAAGAAFLTAWVLRSQPASGSRRAYCSMSSLCPTSTKATFTRALPPLPSIVNTTPSPNLGWRTRCPRRKGASAATILAA